MIGIKVKKKMWKKEEADKNANKLWNIFMRHFEYEDIKKKNYNIFE